MDRARIGWIAGVSMAVVATTGCGGGDSSGADVTGPGESTVAEARLEPLADAATSRRVDLTVSVPDSGAGVAAVEVWARPQGEDWALAASATTPTVRVTIEESGPFGPWEFAAVAVGVDGTREAAPDSAEARTRIPEPIYLTDRSGERWEITHAVLRYGMGEHGWGHGIGRHAILPLIDPPMSCPGDPDYLLPDNLSLVIGVSHGGEDRAYKIGDLNDREVVDDTFGETHLAVTY